MAKNDDGIHIEGCSDNSISGNNIMANVGHGIRLWGSSGHGITENDITSNWNGVCLEYSSNNFICHNSFMDNTNQVYSYLLTSVWDGGYPSCGNYWSDYSGMDLYGGSFQNETGSDGIGDAQYVIDDDNIDRYPLMSPYWSPCDINHDLKVDMEDVNSAARAFGGEPGNERWNCQADITGPVHLEPDNRVDIRDIALIARHFGETYP